MPNTALLATRYARRPLLIEPSAARALVRRLEDADPRGMRRESRFEAALRKLGLGRPKAMEDADDYAEAGPARPACYCPLWLQQTYGEPDDEGFAWTLKDGVALMEISTALAERGDEFCGTWFHGYDTLLAGMREALADERVHALFIRIDSPGGVAAGGITTLAAFMRESRAAAGGKPIWAYADMACSAAYWIAAQCDRIVAPALGYVGSIGAVLIHEDWSGALEQAGIKITDIRFGEKKTDGADFKALDEGAKADLQRSIDNCGALFVADVALGRPQLTAEALIATQAAVYDGQTLDNGPDGLSLGFVDAIATEEQAFAELLASVSAPDSASDAGT